MNDLSSSNEKIRPASTSSGIGSQSNIFAIPNNTQLIQSRYQSWLQSRDSSFSHLLAKLKDQLTTANSFTREANFLAEEMAKSTEYSVTLQIPSTSLNPNGKRSGIISEPAILVRRDSKPNQIWSLEKLENKIILMKELYDEWKDSSFPNRLPRGNPFNLSSISSNEEDSKEDPFFDAQEDHNLIGVANIYLKCLLQKVAFKYEVPVINQQGEISGKVVIELSLVKGELFNGEKQKNHSIKNSIKDLSQSPTFMRSSLDSNNISTITNINRNTAILSSNDDLSRLKDGDILGSYVTVKVRIISASNLPLDLSQFVFCKYKFWGEITDTIVPPTMQPENVHHSSKNFAFKFDHSAEYSVLVTDDLLEHFAEDALSVEVFGNKNSEIEIFRQYERSLAPIERIIQSPESHLKDNMYQKEQNKRNTCKDFSDRWREMYRKLELWVCIEELNEEGSYQKVEVTKSTNINAFETATGGVFQLRHGQTRRVRVCLRPNKISRGYRGSLPIIFDKVEKIYIGDIVKVPKPRGRFLDSYQEEGLNQLRESWCCAVNKRHEHLNDQLRKLTQTENKTVSEGSREKTLMDQWMRLTEEREAVLVPVAGSGIPGAPAAWNPVDGMERHCPVVFINTGGKEISCASSSSINEDGKAPFPMVGDTNLLTGCLSENIFLGLPIIKRYGGLCGAVAQWDSSIHDNICLNTVTHEDYNIFLTVKVVVRLNQPHFVDLVLRKRICINLYKNQGLSSFLKKQWNRYVAEDSLQTTWSGVTYQIVAGIPQASLDIEDRESLAELAASDLSETSETSVNQESYIEKYIRSVSAVEELLQLDRIRQEVACQEIVTHARKEGQFLVKSVNPESAMKEIQNYSSCVLACRSGEEISVTAPSQITNIFNDIDVLDSQQEYITNMNVAIHEESATGLSRAQSSIILDQERRLMSPMSGSNPQLQSNLAIKLGNENRSSTVPKRPQPPKNLLATNQFSSMNLATQWSNKSHSIVVNGNKNNQISMKPKMLCKNETKKSLTEHSVLPNTHVRNSNSDDFKGAIEKNAIKIPFEGYESSMTGSSKISRMTQNPNDGLGLRTSTISENLTKETDISWNNDIIVGSRVSTLCNTGETVNATVKYFDETHLGEGLWLGLELDEPKGSHDGTVDGNAYYSCASNRGMFVLPHKVFVLKSTDLPHL